MRRRDTTGLRRRLSTAGITVGLALAVTGCSDSGSSTLPDRAAAAGATPSVDTTPPPGTLRSTDPTRADSGTDSSGLALYAGATLAPPKILDIGSDPVDITQLTSDQDGAEHRQASEKEKQ